MNPAFYVGQQIGNNLGNAFRRVKDESSIEQILVQSMQSQDPAEIQHNIGKILSQVSPERQATALNFLENLQSNIKAKQEKSFKTAAELKAGVTPGLHPSLQTQQLKNKQQSDAMAQVFGQPQAQDNQDGAAPVAQGVSPVNPFTNMTDEQLALAVGNPYKQISEPAKQEINRRVEKAKILQKQTSEKNQRLAKRNDPIIKSIDEDTLALPRQQALLNSMKNQVESGALGGFSLNWLAELTGQDWMLSTEAAVFKSGAKQYFLSDVERIKGRANQLLEKQIINAQAKIGQSTGANLSVIRGEQMKLDIKKKEIEIANNIIDKYREKGEEPPNLAKEINEQMQSVVQNIEDQTQNDISAITYTEDGTWPKFTPVKDNPPITPVIVKALIDIYHGDKEKAREKAIKLGYTF